MCIDEIPMFEHRVPFKQAFCSWIDCPCEGDGEPINIGEGYIYITQAVIDFRKDCLSWSQYMAKMDNLTATLNNQYGVDYIFHQASIPILVCNKGIDLLGINKGTAREDAIRWWSAGRLPLRASPLKKNQ